MKTKKQKTKTFARKNEIQDSATAETYPVLTLDGFHP